MEEKSILICSDSLEGIFTGVYDGWTLGNQGRQVEICVERPAQSQLFAQYRTVETDEEKAGKVTRTICQSLGRQTYEQICYAAHSVEEDKGTCIYYALREGLAGGKADPDALQNLKNPYILRLAGMRLAVWHEMHRFLGFVRFREIKDKILLSVISPDNPVLPLLGPHFADRLPGENWIIYDEKRQDALVHPAGKPWHIRRQAPLEERWMKGELVEEYASLWKEFCQSVSVSERENPRAQRQNLPHKYRKHMTEFGENHY